MFRIIRADKDAYVCNKIISSTRPTFSRSTDANVGQAATLDLYKLYNETTVPSGSSGIELSRGLVRFDLSPLRALTGSMLNYASSSFKCYLQLKDVYGGQTVPSNFTLAVHPLNKAFSEGRGTDVIGYRDLDAVNWITSSIDNGTVTAWTSGGCGYGASSDDVNADYLTFFSSSLGYVPLTTSQSFARGDEDLYVDVTTAVSATLAGLIPDYGFRIAFSGSQETDSVTRFVKRFSTAQSQNTNRHPALVVKYDNSVFDNQAECYFDYPNRIGTYHSMFGQASNFVSGAFPVTGSGSIMLELAASQSAYVLVTTYSLSHSASISYMSASWVYFSQSFTGSQLFVGGIGQTGSYYADVYLPRLTSGLSGALNSSGEGMFVPTWKSPEGAVIFDVGPSITFRPQAGSRSSIPSSRNLVVNITNLKGSYITTEAPRLRVLAVDYDTTLNSFYMPYQAKPRIFRDAFWRLVDPYTKDVLIPFDDSATRLSSDGDGMYFDMWMSDVPINRPYELQLMIDGWLVENHGFVFRVVT